MKLKESPKKKTGIKSSNKQTARKNAKQTARKTGKKVYPKWKTLKKLAPLSVEIPSPSNQSLKKVAWEETLEVKRTFQEGPDSIYDPYYRDNPDRHHVWTNHLVIGSDTFQKYLAEKKRVDSPIKMKDLKRLKQQCLDDPEKHFYIEDLSDEMGSGLFAKHAIPANSIIGEYTGELISKEENIKRWNENRKATNYYFDTCTNFIIDAGAMGNHTRFINHDCEDQLNCRTEYTMIDGIPRNFIISNRAIEADEQIFIWYGEGYFRDFDCGCKSKNCFSEKKSKK